MNKLSKRDIFHSVSFSEDGESWKMDYQEDGTYVIYKNGKQITEGKYDNVIANSYNDQGEEKRTKQLLEDLKSWKNKAIDEEFKNK